MIARLRSRRGALALTFALSVLLVVFLTTMATMMALSLAGAQAERAVVGTQALYAAEAGLEVMLQTGQSGPLRGALPRGAYAVQRVGGRIVAMGQAQRALGAPVRRVVSVNLSGSDWRGAPPLRWPQLAAILDREAATP
ncbi:MAG: hypothetical protein KKI08_08910 [Armatimonadetes bacterium]|nr:hypothetical protein [Armatimonadota bacterium]